MTNFNGCDILLYVTAFGMLDSKNSCSSSMVSGVVFEKENQDVPLMTCQQSGTMSCKHIQLTDEVTTRAGKQLCHFKDRVRMTIRGKLCNEKKQGYLVLGKQTGSSCSSLTAHNGIDFS